MKRNILSVISLVIFLGIFFITPAMGIPTASLNLVNSPFEVGDTFEVEVWADGDDSGWELLSYGFDITFNSGGIFNYTGYTLGSGFDDDSLVAGNDVAGSAFPGIAENDVLLATLSFSTIALGSDTLRVTGNYDAMFSGLYYELPDWSLVGYDISASFPIAAGIQPIPEPATLFLVGTGLVTLARLRRNISK